MVLATVNAPSPGTSGLARRFNAVSRITATISNGSQITTFLSQSPPSISPKAWRNVQIDSVQAAKDSSHIIVLSDYRVISFYNLETNQEDAYFINLLEGSEDYLTVVSTITSYEATPYVFVGVTNANDHGVSIYNVDQNDPEVDSLSYYKRRKGLLQKVEAIETYSDNFIALLCNDGGSSSPDHIYLLDITSHI